MLSGYTRVKETGIQWLGKVPAHWAVAPVKRHYLIQLGKMLQSRPSASGDCKVRYLRAKNVQWGDVDFADVDTMYANADEMDRYGVRVGDLLVCEGGEGGRCAIVTSMDDSSPCIIQNALHRVRVRSKTGETHGCNNYLRYVLTAVSSVGWFRALNDKATIAHFTAEKFGALPVPMPSPLEQSAIVRFLDYTISRIDRYIRAKEKLITLLEEQRRVIIDDAVRGRTDVRTGKPCPDYKPSGLEWLGDVPAHWEVARNGRLFAQRNEIGYSELPILEVSLRSGVRVRDFDNSNRKQVMSDLGMYKRAIRGDIAYNMMRMWQGAVGVAPVDGLVSPAYVVAKPLRHVEPRYFDHLFHTSAYMIEVDKFSRGIVKDRNRLYWEDFKQMPSPFPPLGEQVLIADAVDRMTESTSRAMRNVQNQICLATEYRTRLVADAVTGKVDVREATAVLPDDCAFADEDGLDEMLRPIGVNL